MPFSPNSIEEKPYNACLDCVHIGKNCDGPNFLAMDMHRLSEWCRLRKEYLHNKHSKWKNEYIAEEAGLSEITVTRFLSGKVEDTKISTAARILRVLVNGSWGQYPCAMGGESEVVYQDNPALVEKCERLQREVDFLTSQVEFKEQQMLTKDKLLDERRDFLYRKDRIITTLSILLAITLLVIIAALVADKLNPNIGFFWRELVARVGTENEIINQMKWGL